MASTDKVTVWPLPVAAPQEKAPAPASGRCFFILFSLLRSGRAGRPFLPPERDERPPKGESPFGNPLRSICFVGKAGSYLCLATSYGRSGGRLFPSPHQILSPRSAPRSRCQKSEVRFQSFSPKVGAKFWFCALFRRSTDPIHGILWQSNIFVLLPVAAPKAQRNADNLQKSHCW